MEVITALILSAAYIIGMIVFCIKALLDPDADFSRKDKVVVVLLSLLWPVVTVVFLLNK